MPARFVRNVYYVVVREFSARPAIWSGMTGRLDAVFDSRLQIALANNIVLFL